MKSLKKRYHSLLDKQVCLLAQMNILVKLIPLCDEAYYKGIPVISDSEYDNYYNILKEIETHLPVNWAKIKVIKGILNG